MQAEKRQPKSTDNGLKLRPEDALGLLSRLAAHAWEPLALNLSRNSSAPTELKALPRNIRSGCAARGQDILDGRYRDGDVVVRLSDTAPWALPSTTPRATREALHSFAWLLDLCATIRTISDPREATFARETGRLLIARWISANEGFSEQAWRPEVAGRRMFCWLTSIEALAEGSGEEWLSAIRQSLAYHARYLARTAELSPSSHGHLVVPMASVLACLALGDAGPRRQRAIQVLSAELKRQILPDGGHISRSPAILLDTLADILILQEAFELSNTPMPQTLQDTLDGMMPMLRFFHTGNGALAAFHGSGMQDPNTIQAVLAADRTHAKPLKYARHSGFHRMSANGTLIIVDAGTAPPLDASTQAHASWLAFELSANEQRIIINCGRSAGTQAESMLLTRSSHAHSTLSFIDASGGHFISGQWANKSRGARLLGGPSEILSQRHEEHSAGYGGQWLELSHDAYAQTFGFRHVRRIYLQERGDDIRGEDRLEAIEQTGAVTPQPGQFALRFHIHPEVKANLANGENAVTLTLNSGDIWRFQCKGATVALVNSTMNGPDGPRASKQIVLKGETGVEPISLRWAFKRSKHVADAGLPTEPVLSA